MTVKAAIDIGSNTIKLLVLDLHSNIDYCILHDSQTVTGLGTGLDAGGRLDPGAFQRSVDRVKQLVEQARSLKAVGIRIAGTSALRRATDADAFAGAILRETGIELEVLSGEREGELSRIVALRELNSAGPDLLFFDVGGGSTELTLINGGTSIASLSLPLGARRLAEDASLTQPPDPNQAALLRTNIKGVLDRDARRLSEKFPQSGLQVAGLGGTAAALAWMIGGTSDIGFEHHMYEIPASQAEQAVLRLQTMNLDEVCRLPKMDQGRAVVFFAGVLVIVSILEWSGADRFTLVDRGLRFGLLLGE